MNLPAILAPIAPLLAHLIGDYLLQSDWMASTKTKSSWPALVHALTYTLPFLVITSSVSQLLFIVGTHFVIDRWRLARYVCWAKNWLAPARSVGPCDVCDNPQVANGHPYDHPCKKMRNWPWEQCVATGYGPDKPLWLSVWLLIITDNTMHLCCNYFALVRL